MKNSSLLLHLRDLTHHLIDLILCPNPGFTHRSSITDVMYFRAHSKARCLFAALHSVFFTLGDLISVSKVVFALA